MISASGDVDTSGQDDQFRVHSPVREFAFVDVKRLRSILRCSFDVLPKLPAIVAGSRAQKRRTIPWVGDHIISFIHG
jgi:hypothetical protein